MSWGPKQEIERTWGEQQGAWGPSTWGPSPEHDAAEERRLRAEERRGFLRAWAWVLGALGLAFFVLGPLTGVLIPSPSGASQIVCSQPSQSSTVVFVAQPQVFAQGLAVGERARLAVSYGRVVSVVVTSPPSGTQTVDGIIDSLSPGTDQIEVTIATGTACGGGMGQGGAVGASPPPIGR